MGKLDMSFQLAPEDRERGWISRERYWELVKAAVVSRGDEIQDITPVEGLGYLLTTRSGYIVHHKAMADRIKITTRVKKKPAGTKSEECRGLPPGFLDSSPLTGGAAMPHNAPMMSEAAVYSVLSGLRTAASLIEKNEGGKKWQQSMFPPPTT